MMYSCLYDELERNETAAPALVGKTEEGKPCGTLSDLTHAPDTENYVTTGKKTWQIEQLPVIYRMVRAFLTTE